MSGAPSTGERKFELTAADLYAVNRTNEAVAPGLEPASLGRRMRSGKLITYHDFERQSEEFKAWARRRKKDIDEIRRGIPLEPGGVPRPEYGPDVLLEEKCKTKSAELRSLDESRRYGVRTGKYDGMSPATLGRQVRAVNKYGILGLMSGDQFRETNEFGRTDPQIIGLLQQVRVSLRGKSTPSFRRVQVELLQLIERRAIEVDLPSENTLRKTWETICGRQDPTKKGPRAIESAELSPSGRQQKGRGALAPGALCEIDTYRTDVQVLDVARKRRLVAQLTAMIDACTGSIIASSVVATAAKGFDHTLLLARAMSPPKRRRGNTEWLDFKLAAMPWAEELKRLDRPLVEECEAAAPWIRVVELVHDRGADYMSQNLQDSAEAFGVTTTVASTRTPTDKPHIESFWKTAEFGFMQYLPGYTGGSPGRREIRETPMKDLLTIAELAELFDRWVIIDYQNIPVFREKGFMPGTFTPNERLVAFYSTIGMPPPQPEADIVSYRPIGGIRVVQPGGIRFENKNYDSPLLNEHRGKKFEVRYDPANPSSIWVRDPVTQGWIECLETSNQNLKHPFAVRLALEVDRIENSNNSRAEKRASLRLVKDIKRTIQLREERQQSRLESGRELRELEGSPARPQPVDSTSRALTPSKESLPPESTVLATPSYTQVLPVGPFSSSEKAALIPPARLKLVPVRRRPGSPGA